MPRMYCYRGFIMIDPGDNLELYNKLHSSTFLTPKKNSNMFYCMIDNYGIKFINNYMSVFKDFDISEEVKELLRSGVITYVDKWPKKKKPVTFDGITWKPHQVKALDLIAKYKQYCIFLGPGTGKTLIALGAIKMIDEGAGNYLVVTPKKAISQYSGEIEKYVPDIKDRITVINYDSIDKAPKIHYKAMILDESHRAKNISSGINKKLCKIDAECVYLFTGTPQDKQRDEVMAQLRILNKNFFEVQYLFYDRFFVLDDYFKPIKELHTEELKEIISQCSYGDKTENLIDLPEEQEKVMPCILGDLADTYKQFKTKKVLRGEDWYALGDSGAKLRTKLTQLCSGFIIDEEGKEHRTPYNPKAEGLRNLLIKCDKAIIYTCFDEEQVIVEEILKEEKKSYVIVNGKTKDSAHLLKKFKDGVVNYLVIQIVSGNAALDFPNINNIIYYSLHDSYIYFEQSKYRIRRIGQTKVCNYYYLIVKNSVEVARLRSLKNKKSFNNKEFDLYRRNNE